MRIARNIGSKEELTIVDSSRNKTCEREHPIEDTVCGVHQGGILEATGAEVRNGAEHANGRETGNAWVDRSMVSTVTWCTGSERTSTARWIDTDRLGQPESWGSWGRIERGQYE